MEDIKQSITEELGLNEDINIFYKCSKYQNIFIICDNNDNILYRLNLKTGKPTKDSKRQYLITNKLLYEIRNNLKGTYEYREKLMIYKDYYNNK